MLAGQGIGESFRGGQKGGEVGQVLLKTGQKINNVSFTCDYRLKKKTTFFQYFQAL